MVSRVTSMLHATTHDQLFRCKGKTASENRYLLEFRRHLVVS